MQERGPEEEAVQLRWMCLRKEARIKVRRCSIGGELRKLFIGGKVGAR